MSSHLRTLSSASVLDVLRRGGDPRVRFDGVPLTSAELDEICRTVARPASARPAASPPLRELSFASCGLGCADAARLLRSLRRGGRVGVDLSGNRLGAHSGADPTGAFVDFMTAVAAAARASAVASLHLSDNGLHADDILLLRRLVAPLSAAPAAAGAGAGAAAAPPPLQLYVSSPPRLPLREMAPPSPPQPAVPRVQARSTSAASRLTFETPPSSSGGLTSFGTPLSTHGGGGGGGGGAAAAAPSPADDTMLLYAEDDCDEFVPPPPTPPRQSQTPASLLVKREAARSGSSGEPSPRPSDSVAPWCPPAAVRPPAVREESGGGNDGGDAAAPTTTAEDDGKKARDTEAAEASAPVTPPPRSPPSGAQGRSAEGGAGASGGGGGGCPSPGKERGPRRSLAAELRRVAPAPSAVSASASSSVPAAAAPAAPSSLAASVAPVTPPKQRQSTSPVPTVSPAVPVPSPLVDRAREWRRHVDARSAARPAAAATATATAAASSAAASSSSSGDAARQVGAAPKKPMLSVSVRQEGRGVVYSSSSDAERSKSCKLDRDVAYEILLENRSPTAHFVCKVVLHGQAMPCLFKVVPVSHHRVSAWRQQGVAVSFAPPLPFPPAAENGKLKVEFYRATVDSGTGRWNYDHRLPTYVVHTDVKSGSKKKAPQARHRSVTPTTQRRTRSVSPAATPAAASRSGSLRGYRQGTCSSVGRQQRVGAGRQPSTSGGASSASHASSASGLAKARVRSSSRGQRDVSPGALFRRSHTLR